MNGNNISSSLAQACAAAGHNALTPTERAQKIILECLCLKKEETLLVVTDETTHEVGKLFYDAAREIGFLALLLWMPETTVSGQEPPATVAAAMRAADVALCPTAQSITHTNARIDAAAAGTRVITMPGVTMDMMRSGATCADYREVEALTKVLTDLLTQASTARIEKNGHVLTMNIEGRHGVASPGVYRNPGASGNFPSGEAYIAPIETDAHGSTAIDGSMVGIGALATPLIATLENGILTSLDGDRSDEIAILFARP